MMDPSSLKGLIHAASLALSKILIPTWLAQCLNVTSNSRNLQTFHYLEVCAEMSRLFTINSKGGPSMSAKITTIGVHHIRLIVTDPIRSRDFYTSLLNFTVAAELPPGFVLTNGQILLGVTPPWDRSQAIENDRFSPHRVGLDHLSFGVADRAALE